MALDPRITVMPDGSYFYSGSIIDRHTHTPEIPGGMLVGKNYPIRQFLKILSYISLEIHFKELFKAV